MLREVRTIARLTMRRAVEQIAREMDGRTALIEIAQEAARRCGRPYTDHTKRTVADALARLPFIVRCAPGKYAPVRVALDGKAFRVPLTRSEVKNQEMGKRRLEPFFTALGKPVVLTEDGRELLTQYLSDAGMDALKPDALKATIRALRAKPWLERILQRTDPEKILEQAWEELDVSRVDSGYIDLTPLGLDASDVGPQDDHSELAPFDLIVRWDGGFGVLRATVSPRADGESSEAIASEDRVLADFIASKLPRDNAVSLASLLLEAYARFPVVGRTPGSVAFDVVRRDPRMRFTAGDAWRPDEVAIARADTLTWEEKHFGMGWEDQDDWAAGWRQKLRARIKEHPRKVQEAWERERHRLGLNKAERADGRDPNVVAIRRPPHEELIAEWDGALRNQGVSDKVRQRKIGHVETFVDYLNTHSHETSSHLLDVGESDLESFFFWTYIRRFPNSRSDATSFTLDLRDFYRYQERSGRIADARFAELIHGVRAMIVERIELYEGLMSLADDDDIDELYETLFIG